MRARQTAGGWVPVWIMVVVGVAGGVRAGDSLCTMEFTTCPESFHGDTIVVPPYVHSISSNIHACQPTDVIEGIDVTGQPPSIVFVIDHSYSMMGLGNTYPGNDTTGSRFNVVRDLIDTIAVKYPAAEIGIVVFREVLFFDHRVHNHFVALPGHGDESYLPLMRLDQRYGPQSGLQVVKNVLQTEQKTGRNPYHDNVEVDYIDLKLQPRFSTIGNTNINTAMDAAKEAMKSATYPGENRFVVFLSDGEPYPRGDPSQHGGKDPFHFQQGEDMPTTFTVYLTNDDQAPASLVEMTRNIQVNNYSNTNPKSNLWTIETNYGDLLGLLMEYVYKAILVVTQGSPRRVTINGLTSTTYEDSVFTFPARFPLDEGVTTIDFEVAYRLTVGSTGAQRDTVVSAQFYVRRAAGAQLPAGVEIVCWEAPALQLYYHGQPVIMVTETMDTLEVRFTTGDRTVDSVTVVVTHQAGTAIDEEWLRLIGQQGTWSNTFLRELATTPTSGDGTLQHWFPDSIIVEYRNPDDPLDTARLAVPFVVTKKLVVESVTYFDNDADGFIDSLFVGMGAGIPPADLGEMMALLELPSHRGFVITDTAALADGIGVTVEEKGAAQPRTGTTADDRAVLASGILPGGGLVVADTLPIHDRVAPVINQARIVLAADSTDTLTITFSEPVNKTDHSQPYKLKNRETGEYELTLRWLASPSGERHVYVVTAVSGAEAPQTGDSIWIDVSAHVRDIGGNTQDNPANRRVTLNTKEAPLAMETGSVNNPFTPGAPAPNLKAAPSVLRKEWSRVGGGVIVTAQPKEEVRRSVPLTGSVSIYDIVNNPVATDLPMVLDSETNRLFLVWDGRNSRNRKVATGTYLAVVTITQDGKPKEESIVRIGVKR